MLTTAPAPLSPQVRDLEGGVVRREGRAAKQTEAEARGMPPAGYQHGARSARRAHERNASPPRYVPRRAERDPDPASRHHAVSASIDCCSALCGGGGGGTGKWSDGHRADDWLPTSAQDGAPTTACERLSGACAYLVDVAFRALCYAMMTALIIAPDRLRSTADAMARVVVGEESAEALRNRYGALLMLITALASTTLLIAWVVVSCRLGKRASDAMLGCVSCLRWGCSCARCWRACIGRGAQNGASDRYAEGTDYGYKYGEYEGERYGGRAGPRYRSDLY